MTDILGLVDSPDLLMLPEGTRVLWIANLIAALLALFLIAKALWMRYGHLLEKDEMKLKKRREYQELSRAAGKDGIAFLRSAGAFIERWLGRQPDPEIGAILAERDDICFRARKEEAAVPRKRREEILRSLRKAAFGLLFFGFCALLTPSLAAAETDIAAEAREAYEAAKYEEAAKLWLYAGPYERLSPTTLYNIGNAAYRMGAPGHAALFYRRALARDTSHAEALQNLRFIQRKYGSITVDRPSYQYALTKLPLDAWQAGLFAGLWLILLGFLVFPATRHGARLRVAAVAGFILGPILISLGALGWRYYPDDAEFAPLAKQAVIIGEKVVLHADAARTSPEVIDAPPGSLAEVIQRSGRWVYVGFATKTRGWVPVEAIEMIIPQDTPEPPKIRKAPVDGSSA